MSTAMTPRERLDQLLTQSVTEGLDATERAEFSSLLARYPNADLEGLELAAAAIYLAHDVEQIALPPGLEEKLLAAAGTASTLVSGPRPAVSQLPVVQQPRALSNLGWLAAAAAVIAALLGWWPRLSAPPERPPTSVAQARESLLAQESAVRIAWTRTEDASASAADGDVVWSSVGQTGFMHFHGLAANDPTVSQYQLWIFDADRDERYPVDGGVFDIPDAAADTLVPIAARLPVKSPTLFAVTIEKPGGTVVSDRSRIVLVASMQ